ncbi:tetratricopeptide repeat protein [Amantichitinum ursilacus]|uniref:Uncharacterized protein n=1 Tax=Amantichitinum ursilacus TaxID=857265 RepID=A0A0N0XNW9_9NEIS|nr:tetratricopeptide repeat protein [Amantichitinum ursilacus]KPC55464.1 hypothetical protein WG78_02365 [Amantichitinum ursilacus]
MRWINSVLFAVLTTTAALALALPTLKDVEATVRQGNYTEAQQMMQQVVEAKPGSAKAHYIYAEILAHNGKFEDATAQALQAKQLDPKITFTDPQKFRRFEALLLNSSQKVPAPQSTTSGARAPQSTIVNAPAVPMQQAREQQAEQPRGENTGFSWAAIGLIVIAAVGIWMMVRRRRQAAVVYPAGNYGPAGSYGNGGNYGPAGGYGPGPVGNPGGGSGIGTGIAAGVGGFAAGMLAEELLSRHNGGGERIVENNTTYITENNNGAPYGADADQQLRNDQIDFGNGSDWDSGGGDSGGGFDSGSSDDNW